LPTRPPTPRQWPRIQACINAYVLKNPSFQANFGCSGAGAGAAAQNCVNAMVDFAAGSRCGMQQQQCVHSPGVNCTRQYQACINAFAVAIQEQGGGGAVGAAGVAPPQQPTKAQLGAPCANITALAAQQVGGTWRRSDGMAGLRCRCSAGTFALGAWALRSWDNEHSLPPPILHPSGLHQPVCDSHTLLCRLELHIGHAATGLHK
jgi:hypothetical protein